jgi:hypothetical protein
MLGDQEISFGVYFCFNSFEGTNQLSGSQIMTQHFFCKDQKASPGPLLQRNKSILKAFTYLDKKYETRWHRSLNL